MPKITAKVVVRPSVPIPIRTECIALDAFLKLANAAESGGFAKQAVQSGAVRVNGEPCTRRGKKLRPGDVVAFAGEKYLVAGSQGA
ncbi:MAG: RNA-binding S4 domain-containing protein [Oscillospiraceae bacterium]|jgi:ribosome-associated protein|nr:RNA-binding S4 domain-containing protein [Oscillospiraceae bacterium]